MASGGEVGGTRSDNIGSEDLEDVKCQPCQEDGELREVVGMCIDCQEYLCQRCYDIHTIPKPSRNHQLQDKQEIMESHIRLTRKDKCTIRCPKHVDKIVKYYCATHGQLSCSVCLNLDHRVCKGVIYIPDVASDIESNKEYRSADDHLSLLLARFKKAAEIAENNSEALESSYTKTLEMIRVFRNEINDAIDRIERELLEKASELKSKEMEEMACNDEDRKHAESQLKDTVAKLETFRTLKHNCNLFTEMMMVQPKLDALDDQLNIIERGQYCSKTEIKFTPNTDTLDLLKSTEVFGKLTVAGKRDINQDASSSVSCDSTIVKAEYSHDINVRCDDDKSTSNCWITGSAILPDNRLLVVDRNHRKIKVIDVKNGIVSSYLALSSQPWDIAVINNNQVAVTLPEANKVDFITTVGGLTVDRSVQLREECHGIDYRGGQLAISFAQTNQIKILDLQGTELRRIKPIMQGRQLYQTPNYVCFGPDSTTLYVSNHISHEVVCTKLDGTVVGSYRDTRLKGPLKIVLDRYDNVYVCGRESHTIHLLSTDCKSARVLLTNTDGLDGPYTVSYSESGDKLYVGMFLHNDVKVYKVTLG